MPDDAAMRLANFPMLRATCFDELQAVLAGKGLRSERGTGGGDGARMNTAYNGDWYVACMDYDMPLRIAAPAERDDYTLYLPLDGGVRASDGHDNIECSRTRTVLASPQRPLLTQTGAHARRVNLSLKRDVVMRHLAALLDDAPARAPQFAMTLDLGSPRMRAYVGYLWGVVAALEQDAGFMDQPLVGRAVEEALVAGLLLAQPHDYTDRLGATPALAPASVKRALDFMEAHLDGDITLGGLAAVARVPARTLQAHFHDRFGCGPMDYLRGRRLCQARAELTRGEGTVTTVALRWGFGSLGRFAGAYRARFGELPSQTLRRARG